VAVDEARDRAHFATVHLDDVVVECRQVRHEADGLNRVPVAEDERAVEHLDLAERGAAQRRVRSGGRRHLRQIADEQPLRHASVGACGIRRPASSAAAIASG
jgi:hypothetical protein